jgi:hypothetical protein
MNTDRMRRRRRAMQNTESSCLSTFGRRATRICIYTYHCVRGIEKVHRDIRYVTFSCKLLYNHQKAKELAV